MIRITLKRVFVAFTLLAGGASVVLAGPPGGHGKLVLIKAMFIPGVGQVFVVIERAKTFHVPL